MGIQAYQFGNPPKFNDVKMQNFKGVDFANDPSEVALYRSPNALNVMSSYSDVIEKRPGYTVENDWTFWEGDGEVRNFYLYHIPDTQDMIYYVHVGYELWYMPTFGTQAYQWDEVKYIIDGVPSNSRTPDLGSSCEFVEFPNYGLYVLCGNAAYDTVKRILKLVTTDMFGCIDVLHCASEAAYIHRPTTVIARAPTGGGDTYEAINMANKIRINSFLGVAAVVDYQLDATSLDASAIVDDFGYDTTNQIAGNYVHAQILQSNGTYTTIVEGSGLHVHRDTGVVTFDVAPGVTPITGQDNVLITFAKSNETNFQKLAECRAHAFYGFNGARDYVFLGGGDHYPNTDYQGFTNTFYFPETGYSQIGNGYNAIMGYGRFNDAMIIHKGVDDNGDPGVYLRTANLDSNNEVVFPISQGISTVGTIARGSIATMRDDPMWMCDFGIVALVTNNITNVRSVQERGYFIHKRLLKETYLSEAVSTVYDNRYILAVPSHDDEKTHVYVADSRKRYNEPKANAESFQYEWYYWEFPCLITWIGVFDETLWFGTRSNVNDPYARICYLKPYDDPLAYYDGETPIQAYWSSPLLYMEDITAKKSLKNFWVRMVQYLKSSAKIYYKVRGGSVLVKEASYDMFSFENINFERFTFDTDDNAEVLVTNRMERQFMAIQFMVRNDAAEPFGLIEMAARYRTNATYKGGV
jgi:hypothetical protein